MAGRSNKYNKLWSIITPANKKDVINYVRETLDKLNAIYAEESAEMDTYVFYLIGTQHRFMSICEKLGTVKLYSGGCEMLDVPSQQNVGGDKE